eukprot:scaffold106541_cov16-Tisochrysis_lutea.AAC.1
MCCRGRGQLLCCSWAAVMVPDALHSLCVHSPAMHQPCTSAAQSMPSCTRDAPAMVPNVLHSLCVYASAILDISDMLGKQDMLDTNMHNKQDKTDTNMHDKQGMFDTNMHDKQGMLDSNMRHAMKQET